jgi:hypothetical protein
MKLKYYLAIGAVVILLCLGFYGGYKTYPHINPYPVITTDTIYLPDNSWHHLRDSLNLSINNLQSLVNYWKAHRDTLHLPGDTVLIPMDVDTAAILKDHFAIYKYGWEKQDSDISVIDSVTITQNTPIKHSIDYQFKKPFTTIINNVDNSISYNNYLQFGVGLPVYKIKADSTESVNLNNIRLELTYVFKKGYVGIDWQPNTNTIEARLGTTILKFKQKK